MFEVRVEADFAAAHFLRDYNGKCENLHGHNYKVYAHVRGNKLDEGGMLLDFSELKKTLRDVCALLDHYNLNEVCIVFLHVKQYRHHPASSLVLAAVSAYHL